MNIKNLIQTTIAGTLLLSALAVPMTASAQTQKELDHRQQQKNQWRNIGIASGAAGVLGLIKGNGLLAIAGIGGGLYSAQRYEQDRKSQNKMQRSRAEMFRHGYIYRNGHRYKKTTVMKNGHKYYAFVRG